MELEKLQSLKEWVGQEEADEDQVTVPAVHRLAATLDRDDPRPRTGELLPYGWHLILFPRVVRDSLLGLDGHPERGDFLPAVPLPRRMGAGRSVTFASEIRVGDILTRKSRIAAVDIKEGRSGPIVFVTLHTDIYSERGLAVHEEQQLSYRGLADPNALPREPRTPAGTAVWQRKITPTNVMVYRFSALSFNGHRIHYDYQHATKTEGYPDIVVPGNLPTVLLFELARMHSSRRPVRFKTVTWRNVRPLFVGKPVVLCGEPADGGRSAELWVADESGYLALSMTASFE